MQICSVKKLNKRPCRNKCKDEVCDYHRYHPYLTGRRHVLLNKKRRSLDLSEDTTPSPKKVRFTENTDQKQYVDTNYQSIVLDAWGVALVFFLIGLFIVYNGANLNNLTTDVKKMIINVVGNMYPVLVNRIYENTNHFDFFFLNGKIKEAL